MTSDESHQIERELHEKEKKLLGFLQHTDPLIDTIVERASDVSVYFLEVGEMGSGWWRANIEGPMYLVRRRQAPKYQLLVENTFCFGDLVDGLQSDWQFEHREKWMIYQLADPVEQIRGVRFRNDAERMKMEIALLKTFDEIHNENFAPHPGQPVARDIAPSAPADVPDWAAPDSAPTKAGSRNDGEGEVMLTGGAEPDRANGRARRRRRRRATN